MDFPWNKPSSDKGLSRWLWKLPDIDGPWLPSQQVTVYVKSFRWISQQFPSFFNIQSYPISPLCSLGFPSVATELATLRSGRGRQPGQRSRGAAQSEARFLNRGKSRLVCPEGYNMLQRCSNIILGHQRPAQNVKSLNPPENWVRKRSIFCNIFYHVRQQGILNVAVWANRGLCTIVGIIVPFELVQLVQLEHIITSKVNNG